MSEARDPRSPSPWGQGEGWGEDSGIAGLPWWHRRTQPATRSVDAVRNKTLNLTFLTKIVILAGPGPIGPDIEESDTLNVVAVAEPSLGSQVDPETTSSPEFLAFWNAALEVVTPEGILHWAYETFGEGVALACSFSGPTGMVLLDMTAKMGRAPEVFYLDTGFLFPETHKLRDVAAERYGIQPRAFNPLLTPQQQERAFGLALWARDPDACCAIRKVEPNRRALDGRTAWISGLRRDQGDSRKHVPIVSWDAKFGLVKINPLANWSEKQVWGYIVRNNVPYNVLHDQGYPSIGCTNCTRPVAAGEGARAGRWSGFDKAECGLHTAS
jgi:phosphoadenosine phosphosulfate reductase